MTQLRYIITRPCLLEGSLTIAKYLRPLFPMELAGQALHLRDDQGRDYAVRMTISGGSIIGMGSVYHALNLNVNDVLLIERIGTADYLVQGVTKPYSRPQSPESYGSRLTELPQRRVVVAATPHVREVRLERDFERYYDRQQDHLGAAGVYGEAAPETLPSEAISSDSSDTLPAAQPQGHLQQNFSPVYSPAEEVGLNAGGEATGLAEVAHPGAVRVDSLRLEGGHLEAPGAAYEGAVYKSAMGVGVSKIEVVRPQGRIEARLDGVSRRGGVQRAVPERPRTEKLDATRITAVRQSDSRVPTRDELLRAEAEASRQETTRIEAVRGEVRPEATRLELGGAADFQQDKDSERPTARLADVLVRGTAAAPATRPEATRVDNLRIEEVAARPTNARALPEVVAQLEELAQLTGYRLDYLGAGESGPVRLHADLGAHSYDVLIALQPQDMQNPAFLQGTYRALLTWEVENAAGVPRFTREALTALLEHARLAPLTPVDLRGYWNTPSFDLGSVASVAELVSAYLAQRGTFTYVLSTLAQQPAHSVVDPQLLAQRLGSGVNASELRTVLDTLSRPPFMALLPLPGGQYYLRAEVGTLLGELSSYAAGVARRLQGTRAKR